MSMENFVKLRGKPKSERSAIENAIVFLWTETTGYDYVAFEAAEELSQLKAEIEAEQKRGDMHADINRRSAESLGKPFYGEGSSWHDIPECIAQLKAEREALRALLRFVMKCTEADEDDTYLDVSGSIAKKIYEKLESALKEG